jgi:hypothetical protein
MSKEKFEVAFLAGGLMLNALGTRLRRKATTPRETVGAAMHELTTCLQQQRTALADPEAAEQSLVFVRTELCETQPNRAAVTAHLNRILLLAEPNGAIADAVTKLDNAIDAWSQRPGGGGP